MQSLWRWIGQNQRMPWCQKATSFHNHVLSRGGSKSLHPKRRSLLSLCTQASQASTATFPQDALGGWCDQGQVGIYGFQLNLGNWK